jgi:hypothetical protein
VFFLYLLVAGILTIEAFFLSRLYVRLVRLVLFFVFFAFFAFFVFRIAKDFVMLQLWENKKK